MGAAVRPPGTGTHGPVKPSPTVTVSSLLPGAGDVRGSLLNRAPAPTSKTWPSYESRVAMRRRSNDAVSPETVNSSVS